MVIFKSKQEKLEGDLKIKLCGKRLYPVESVKYLGLSGLVKSPFLFEFTNYFPNCVHADIKMYFCFLCMSNLSP